MDAIFIHYLETCIAVFKGGAFCHYVALPPLVLELERYLPAQTNPFQWQVPKT